MEDHEKCQQMNEETKELKNIMKEHDIKIKAIKSIQKVCSERRKGSYNRKH